MFIAVNCIEECSDTSPGAAPGAKRHYVRRMVMPSSCIARIEELQDDDTGIEGELKAGARSVIVLDADEYYVKEPIEWLYNELKIG